MQLNKKRAAAIVGATTIALGTAGVAFAFWTSSGGGTGTASTSSGVSTIAVTGDDTVNDLAPGVAPEQITATIHNPTNENALVNNLKVEIASVTGEDGTCDAGSYQLQTAPSDALTGGATSGVSNINIPVGTSPGLELTPNGTAGDHTTESFYIGFVDDPAVDQSGCKNGTVNLTYTTS